MEQGTGIISVSGEEATITFKRRLSHPIDKVWEAITEPKKRAKWFGPTTIDPQEGGTMVTTAEGPPAPKRVRRTEAEILVWDPPHVLEYKEKAANIGETIVRFELKTEGDATLLHLTNSRLKPSDARGYAPGWHAFLDRLESHLEGTSPPEWGKRYGEVQHAYA